MCRKSKLGPLSRYTRPHGGPHLSDPEPRGRRRISSVSGRPLQPPTRAGHTVTIQTPAIVPAPFAGSCVAGICGLAAPGRRISGCG